MARLVTRLDFVDDVDLALATDDLAGRVAQLGGFDGGNDFHKGEKEGVRASGVSKENIPTVPPPAKSRGSRALGSEPVSPIFRGGHRPPAAKLAETRDRHDRCPTGSEQRRKTSFTGGASLRTKGSRLDS